MLTYKRKTNINQRLQTISNQCYIKLTACKVTEQKKTPNGDKQVAIILYELHKNSLTQGTKQKKRVIKNVAALPHSV